MSGLLQRSVAKLVFIGFPTPEAVVCEFQVGDQLGNAALKKAGKGRWNKRLRRALRALERLFNYDRVYLGGGNAKKITGALPPKTKTVPNIAGLLGGIALWRANSSGKKVGKGVRNFFVDC